MKRLLPALVSLCVCLAGADRAAAQYYGGGYPQYGGGYPQMYGPRSYYPFPNGSVVSPYLNVSPGIRNSAVGGYLLGTRPEFQRRANDLFYQSSIQNLDRRVFGAVPGEEEEGTLVRGTGTPTAFMNTGGYFPASPFGVQGRPMPSLQQGSARRKTGTPGR
jgi:hypothetical protein